MMNEHNTKPDIDEMSLMDYLTYSPDIFWRLNDEEYKADCDDLYNLNTYRKSVEEKRKEYRLNPFDYNAEYKYIKYAKDWMIYSRKMDDIQTMIDKVRCRIRSKEEEKNREINLWESRMKKSCDANKR
jgi:hypothetical protein